MLTSKLYTNPAPETATIQMYVTGLVVLHRRRRLGLRPLWSKGFPPVLNNFAYYKNPVVDEAIEAGLSTADPASAPPPTPTAQAQAWKDAPLDLPRHGAYILAALFDQDLNGAYDARRRHQFNLDDDATLN